jgi:hypothetical protein
MSTQISLRTLAVLLVVLLGAFCFGPAPSEAGSGVSLRERPSRAESKSRIVDYWTVERMREAEPVAFRSTEEPGPPAEVRSAGAPGRLPPTAPNSGEGGRRALPDFYGSYEIFEYTTRHSRPMARSSPGTGAVTMTARERWSRRRTRASS